MSEEEKNPFIEEEDSQKNGDDENPFITGDEIPKEMKSEAAKLVERLNTAFPEDGEIVLDDDFKLVKMASGNWKKNSETPITELSEDELIKIDKFIIKNKA